MAVVANRVDPEQGLRHQLGAGQMAMVAVGGSIGTGLLLGSAAAMGIAGPAVILSFLLAALINFTVTMALAELSSVHPAAGSFGVYGDLYLNDWAGFVSRAGYWAAISISIGAELVASATYFSYWFPSVPALVWIVTLSILLLLLNCRNVGNYGRFEYWFAMIKVVTVLAFIAVGAALLLSGRAAPHYTSSGGFFPHGGMAPLLAMGFALYTFGGIEMVAITTGESRNVGEIPRAVLLTFSILAVVYLGAITVLVGVMPWNRAGVAESPFVTVFREANIPAATHVMNFVVLTAALSGANAALYVASRMLFSLARSGWAPARLGRLSSAGVPRAAALASSYGIMAALVLEKWAPRSAFVSILGAVLVGMLLSWLVSLAAHVSFRSQLSPDQLTALPIRSPFGVWGSAVGFILVIAAIFEQGSRLALGSGAVFIVLLTGAYFVLKESRRKRTISL
jgi:amino acid transporter, AAT family